MFVSTNNGFFDETKRSHHIASSFRTKKELNIINIWTWEEFLTQGSVLFQGREDIYFL